MSSFLLPVLADSWGLNLVMVAVAFVSFLGFLITAIFGAGLETSGRALEGGDETSAAPGPKVVMELHAVEDASRRINRIKLVSIPYG